MNGSVFLATDAGKAAAKTALAKAFDDFAASLLHPRLWFSLAWVDIVQRYRGSMLGPFWLTLSTGIFILGIGPLYSELLGIDRSSYLPYLTSGILVWIFISNTLNEASRAFIAEGSLMTQLKLPRSVHLLHIVARNIIIFAHHIPLFAMIVVFFKLPVTPIIFLAVPGFFILCLNLLAIGLILSIICVRYRDVIQVVSSLLQLLFFVTPIFWQPGQSRAMQLVSDLNPISALIALIREPLLNQLPTTPQIVIALTAAAILPVSAFLLFARYRQRVIYWV